jgi:hypothetical protein
MMKKNQVQIGGTYVAKVSGQLAKVRIDAESRFGGWDATNVSTHRKVRIKSAQRLRREVSPTGRTVALVPDTTADEDRPCSHCKGEGRFPRCSICGRVYHNAQQDGPPQDIDERLAAAPPSIVPYEQRRARAEAAQTIAAEAVQSVEGDDIGPRYDPSRCATKRCKGAPVMTYLERPLCQACWERHCGEEQSIEVRETPGDACRSGEQQQTHKQENAMSTKKSAKKQTTKEQAKAKPVAAKAKVATTKSAKDKRSTKAKAGVATATEAAKAKRPAKPKAASPASAAKQQHAKPKRLSAIDAAAEVLKKSREPMRSRELITAMEAQGLWTSPGGKTPHATLYAAMLREERDKGTASRFRKVERGLFGFNG